MARHYGIPYMGSKQKLVDHILPFIIGRHPGTENFYDLFGGGGSASLYVVRKYPRLKLVKAIKTRSLLAAAYTDKPSYNYENVYWNGVE